MVGTQPWPCCTITRLTATTCVNIITCLVFFLEPQTSETTWDGRVCFITASSLNDSLNSLVQTPDCMFGLCWALRKFAVTRRESSTFICIKLSLPKPVLSTENRLEFFGLLSARGLVLLLAPAHLVHSSDC